MSRSQVSMRSSSAVGVLLIAAMGASGCRLLDRGQISGTMGYQQQLTEITRIAPYGTLREKAVASLNKAGVVGEYSRAGTSIYYCQLWNRPDGKRWHMTVSLLFNAQGEFYAVNLADADIQQGDAGNPATGTPVPARTGVKSPRSPSGGTSPVPWPEESQRTGPAFPESGSTNPRGGRRSPFEENAP